MRFVIEHPSRGMFRKLNYGYVPSDPVKARFAPEANRSDERIYWAPNLVEAIRMYERIPERVRRSCTIRQAPDYKVVYP